MNSKIVDYNGLISFHRKQWILGVEKFILSYIKLQKFNLLMISLRPVSCEVNDREQGQWHALLPYQGEKGSLKISSS